MKKIKSFIIFVCCFTLVLSFSAIPAYADSDHSLVVEFDNFIFTTEDYDSENVLVEYSKDGLTEVATIRDKVSGEVLEVMEVSPGKSRWTGPHTFTRTSTYGGTTVSLSIFVEMYSEGSFREINSIEGSYLGITTQITNTRIEDKSVAVWPKGHILPATVIYFDYAGTLVAETTSTDEFEISAEISAKLIDAGFSYSHSDGRTSYYRRPFQNSGTISLY